jgi:hypothetical protein
VNFTLEERRARIRARQIQIQDDIRNDRSGACARWLARWEREFAHRWKPNPNGTGLVEREPYHAPKTARRAR